MSGCGLAVACADLTWQAPLIIRVTDEVCALRGWARLDQHDTGNDLRWDQSSWQDGLLQWS
eukprot:2376808-Amphidinium_carterae.1